MARIVTRPLDEDATNRAIELMATLAVLIVAALIFAGAGTRDSRPQIVAAALRPVVTNAAGPTAALPVGPREGQGTRYTWARP